MIGVCKKLTLDAGPPRQLSYDEYTDRTLAVPTCGPLPGDPQARHLSDFKIKICKQFFSNFSIFSFQLLESNQMVT